MIRKSKATGRAKCGICGKVINKDLDEILIWNGGWVIRHYHTECLYRILEGGYENWK